MVVVPLDWVNRRLAEVLDEPELRRGRRELRELNGRLVRRHGGVQGLRLRCSGHLIDIAHHSAAEVEVADREGWTSVGRVQNVDPRSTESPRVIRTPALTEHLDRRL